MHELSLAMAIVEMAVGEAEKNDTGPVQEIELEVGALSGVDTDALEFALSLAVKDTYLEHATVKIFVIAGSGWCNQCGLSFVMEDVLTTCPGCNMPAGKILGGEELRIVSLVVDD